MAEDESLRGLNRAQAETGVSVRTLNPGFNRSSTDETERVAQVLSWLRLPELADAIDCRAVTTDF